jgi:hydrogenase maturation protease
VSELPEISGSCESSHGLSVRDVLALAEATGILPERLSVVAVTGSSFGVGEPLSEAVRDAVQPAADLAAALVARG